MSSTHPIHSVLTPLDGAGVWLNSEPLTAEGLRGSVVAVDFWTYSCVNWLRTLPYLRAWAARYADHGFVLVGAHAPEFGFEHDLDNVGRATRALDLAYPVVIDNDYAIWTAFANHYWPALYLVDRDGRLGFHHFGEGAYDTIERAIQKQLDVDEALSVVDAGGVAEAADFDALGSPETYVGYARGERRSERDAAELGLNEWALSGDWTIGGEAAVLEQGSGSIAYRFHARDLNLVMAPPSPGASARFTVLIDGNPPGPDGGLDVDEAGHGMVSEPRMYQLIRRRGGARDGTFEIRFLDPGVRAYVFTFG
jgi:thiol-disulfide isomerase/thioredoxin